MVKDDNYIAVILEQMRDDYRHILDAVAPIPKMQADIAELKQDVSVLKSEMAAVKLALKATNEDVAELKTDMKIVKATTDRHEIQLSRMKLVFTD